MHTDEDFDWIDITATIYDGMVHWPKDAPVRIFKTEEINNGFPANVSAIFATAHMGTHVDAPSHFFQDAGDIADIQLETLVGRVKVFQISDTTKITYDEIKNLPLNENDRVIFRTANSDIEWEKQPFLEDYVYLTTDAAQYLANIGLKCIGVDYISIGGCENNLEVHRLLLGKPVIIIEGLKLGNVEPGEYEMMCLPLKISNSDGGPARVIIRKTR